MLRDKIILKDGTEDILRKCLGCVEEAEEVVIFGAGVGGDNLYVLLEEHGLEHKICCYSDNNILRIGSRNNGKLIEKPDILIEKYPKASIIIASSAYEQIKNQLLSMGFSEEKIFLFNFAFTNLEYNDFMFFQDHLNEFEIAYELMGDDKSRIIFEKIWNYRITKEQKFLEEMQPYVDEEQKQYFDFELYDLSEDEIVVDAGAYIGDTLEQYLVCSKGKYLHYYAFEAEKNTYNILCETIKKGSYKNVSPICAGLWDKNTYVEFESVKYGSNKIVENKQRGNIKVVSLDEYLEGKPVSFIKMDIEGSEYQALTGMKKTIHEFLPILAFSVYHKRDDFFKLLSIIENNNSDCYKYFIRQYRYTPTETVCYAIPKNRCKKK